jgi:hypothetical protein
VLAHGAAALERLMRGSDVRDLVHAVDHRTQCSRSDVIRQITQHGGVGIALKVRMRRAPYTFDAAIAARAPADSPTVTIRPPWVNRLR